MFCENCGAQIEEDALFCNKCGAKQDTAEPVAASQEAFGQNAATQQVMDQQTVGQQAAYAQQPVQAQKITAPMPAGQKLLIIELVVFLLVCFGAYQVGTKLTEPKTVAENYFKADAAGDYKTLYGMLNLPDSKLLTYDLFMSTMQNTQIKDVANFKVKEDKDFGDEDAISKSFFCEYIAKGDTEPQTEKINLVKLKEKKWLLFDTWTVSPANLVNDYVITAPKNATVTLNGMNVSDIAKSVEEGDGYNYEPQYVSYCMPAMFGGEYDLKMQLPYAEDFEEQITVDCYSQSVRLMGEIVPTEEAEKLFSQMAGNIVQVFYSDALASKDFGTFIANTKLSWSEEEIDSVKYSYEDEVSRLHDNEREIIQSIIPSDMKYEIQEMSINSNGNLEARVYANTKLTVKREKIDVDWWTGEESREQDEYETSDSTSFCFELIDDEWTVVSKSYY